LQLTIADRRVRTASFGASICLVALACTILLINSRAIVFLEGPAIQAVSVQVETRAAPPRPAAHARASGVATTNTTAPPTATAIPVAREILEHVQACSNPRAEDRPANCPHLALPQDWQQSQSLPVGGDFYQPPPVDLSRAFTRSELALANPPPCHIGFSSVAMGNGSGVQYCQHTYPDPPPPTRSAEEVCDAGGIGPCHPPAFRPEDVVMARHTD